MPTRRQIAHVLDDVNTAAAKATTTATEAVTDLITTESDGAPHDDDSHEKELAVAAKVAPRGRGARLPVALQFPLLAVLSFSISSLGYSLMSEWGKGDLAAVSKSLDTWTQVATLAAWRMLVWLGSSWGVWSSYADGVMCESAPSWPWAGLGTATGWI